MYVFDDDTREVSECIRIVFTVWIKVYIIIIIIIVFFYSSSSNPYRWKTITPHDIEVVTSDINKQALKMDKHTNLWHN